MAQVPRVGRTRGPDSHSTHGKTGHETQTPPGRRTDQALHRGRVRGHGCIGGRGRVAGHPSRRASHRGCCGGRGLMTNYASCRRTYLSSDRRMTWETVSSRARAMWSARTQRASGTRTALGLSATTAPHELGILTTDAVSPSCDQCRVRGSTTLRAFIRLVLRDVVLHAVDVLLVESDDLFVVHGFHPSDVSTLYIHTDGYRMESQGVSP